MGESQHVAINTVLDSHGDENKCIQILGESKSNASALKFCMAVGSNRERSDGTDGKHSHGVTWLITFCYKEGHRIVIDSEGNETGINLSNVLMA